MYLNNVIKEVSKFTDLGVTFVGQGEKIFLSYKDIYDYSMKLGSWMNDKGIIKGDSLLFGLAWHAVPWVVSTPAMMATI